MEGAYLIKYGHLPYNGAVSNNGAYSWTGFSEQEVASCNVLSFDCNGGFIESGFVYVAQQGGIMSEQSYPYTSALFDQAVNNGQGTTYACSPPSGGAIVDPATALQRNVPYTAVQPNSVTALMSALNVQPVSITLEADQPVFSFYTGGVITDVSCGTGANNDHAVLAVGYGTMDGIDYW